MLSRLLKPLFFFFAALGVALVLVTVLWFSFDMEFHRKETLTRALSTFVALQPANAYVITSLTNTETFEVLEHHWVLEEYPVGGTEVRVSLPATYHYYVKPEELSFRLENRVLYVNAAALYLLTPVAFDTQQVSQWGEKHWFGRAVATVLKELELSVSGQLEQRGRQHFPLARQQAYEALAMNVHRFLVSQGQESFYEEIVVNFADDPRQLQKSFRVAETPAMAFPFGDGELVLPR